MKRTVIYWKTSDIRRMKAVKAELGITVVSVNGESSYNGNPERLVPYVEEGLITIRIKEYEEIRRKKVCFDPIESKPANCKKVGRGSRTRKV